MTTEARLSIHCLDAGVARSLEQVLSPDNAGFPRGQRFTMAREGRTLFFTVGGGDASSVGSTLSSVLRDVALFQEIWLLSRRGDAAVGSRQ